MNILTNIKTISWAFLDRGLFIAYGLIFLLIINHTELSDFGLYSILIAINSWIFTISDSLNLQNIIQFGMNFENRPKVNLFSFVMHFIFTLGATLVILIFSDFFAILLGISILKEIAFYLLLISLFSIPKYYLQKLFYRDRKMKFLFFSNLVFFASNGLFLLYFIISQSKLNLDILIFGYSIGLVSSSVLALLLAKDSLSFNLKGKISFYDMIKFSYKNTIVSFLFTTPRQLDTVIFKMFFSIELVALYSTARTVFRIFEEGLNVVTALVYPTSVKLITNQNDTELRSLIIKSYSFSFAFFTIITLILAFGLSDYLFNLILPLNYLPSKGYFNILLFAAPFLPFTITFAIMVAKNKMNQLILIVSGGLLVYFLVYYFIGSFQVSNLAPLPFVTFNIFMGSIALLIAVFSLKINLYDLLISFIPDSINFFRKIFKVQN